MNEAEDALNLLAAAAGLRPSSFDSVVRPRVDAWGMARDYSMGEANFQLWGDGECIADTETTVSTRGPFSFVLAEQTQTLYVLDTNLRNDALAEQWVSDLESAHGEW